MGEIKKARPNPPGFSPSGPPAVALMKKTTSSCNHSLDEWRRRIHSADAGQADYWVPPPPPPAPKKTSHDDDNPHDDDDDGDNDDNDHSSLTWLPRPGEQLVKLLGHWRILQRVGSHRWTTDDLVTAYVAVTQCVTSPPPQVEEGAADGVPRLGSGGCTGNSSSSSSSCCCTPVRYLDLGCGNGSVLQMVSWAILKQRQELQQQQQQEQQQQQPQQHSQQPSERSLSGVGVEARAEAVALARRSLAFNLGNSTSCPVQVRHADFRQFVQDNERQYDLITGTPPYFRVDFTTTTTTTTTSKNESSPQSASSTIGTDDNEQPPPPPPPTIVVQHAVIRQGGMPTAIQSAPARCEFRGGIEAYCHAAAQCLEPTVGRFVVCNSYIHHARSQRAAVEAGMEIIHTLLVEGCRGRGLLFVVYVMRLKPRDDDEEEAPETTTTESQLTVREVTGEWTPEYVEQVFGRMSIPGPV
mmetsp:Transcript_20827/g.57586  ORF Transcript_20827/g.57586 Transcript_20827/m.57586 type:complete len:468 (-) Transcript_20827:2521-3924(-)